MQGIIFAACLITISRAQESTIPVGVDGRDTLTQIRVQDNEGNYDIGYNENQLTGGASFMREKATAGGLRKEGSYGYTTRNGLIRIVTYVADENGFRAEVLTNEPGVAAANPSNVTITKEQEPDPDSLTTTRSPLTQRPITPGLVRQYVQASPSNMNPTYLAIGPGSPQIAFASPYSQYSTMSQN